MSSWKLKPANCTRRVEIRLIGDEDVSGAVRWRKMSAAERRWDLECREILATWALDQLGGTVRRASIVAVAVIEEPTVEGPASLAVVFEAASVSGLDGGEQNLIGMLARRRELLLTAIAKRGDALEKDASSA